MITKEKLHEANSGLKTIPQKGKAYVMVNTRVNAFREIEPSGGISTDIISHENGVVVIKATITDEDGKVLSTGIASEKEGSSFVNKTSYIENCETSAVGRALGFLGIGIDDSMASAEEVANAMLQQNKEQSPEEQFPQLKVTASDREIQNFKDVCEEYGLDYKEVWKQTGKANDMSKAHLGKAELWVRDHATAIGEN